MKKLKLNKETIANLNSDMMKNLRGGNDSEQPTLYTCRPVNTCGNNYTCNGYATCTGLTCEEPTLC
ncbi:MAG: class I lanthipeptide [Candidatus Delongbacteria bacterium]|nr:class I lanthipeptide [Candidatus Delongbacteria bacterium]